MWTSSAPNPQAAALGLAASPESSGGQEQNFRIYCRNISTWGHGAKDRIKERKEDMLIFPEAHLDESEAEAALDHWSKFGWNALVAPTRPSERSTKAGGITMGIRNDLSAVSFRLLAKEANQQIGQRDTARDAFSVGPLDFHDIVALQCQVLGVKVTVLGVYLDATSGWSPVNQRKFATITALTRLCSGIWLAVGDWNATPGELTKTGWVEQVGGRIFTPDNVDYTCTAGSGRMIDFCVGGPMAETIIQKISADDAGPWKTHHGLQILLRGGADCNLVRTLGLPACFVHPPAAKNKQKDPSSRRSRQAAAAAAAKEDDPLARDQALEKARGSTMVPGPLFGPKKKIFGKKAPPLPSPVQPAFSTTTFRRSRNWKRTFLARPLF